MAKSNKKTEQWTYAPARRRRATARIRLIEGKGDSMVNDVLVGKYFPGEVLTNMWQRPFSLTETLGKYHFTAKVVGGGKKGQLDAVIHGIAKALSKLDANQRLTLKKAGLLTRDARKRERRKVGTGGKARRAKQSPKR